MCERKCESCLFLDKYKIGIIPLNIFGKDHVLVESNNSKGATLYENISEDGTLKSEVHCDSGVGVNMTADTYENGCGMHITTIITHFPVFLKRIGLVY